MARVYVSYTHADKGIVHQIAKDLRDRGHEILMDTEVVNVGQDFRKALLNELKGSDGVLVLISERSLDSKYVVSEIGSARAFIAENVDSKFLIPVLYGDVRIPEIISDLYCIRLNPDNYQEALALIDKSISMFIGKKEAVREKQSKDRQQIESKAADYIEMATTALNSRERINLLIGNTWYVTGFLTLVIGIYFSLISLASINEIKKDEPWIFAMVILKSVIVIGLLIACSKYAFALGKTHMHEALRNADRLHAISFGKFYLKAFGDKVTSSSEIKEIFQHWNIDKASSFGGLDTQIYDPKFTESLMEIVKTFSKKKGTNVSKKAARTGISG